MFIFILLNIKFHYSLYTETIHSMTAQMSSGTDVIVAITNTYTLCEYMAARMYT